MKCSVIAKGVVQATRELQLEIPLVVRLQGTEVEEGAKLIRESGLKIYAISELSNGRSGVQLTLVRRPRRRGEGGGRKS
jgi:succinyl-CoA synthetase beta subunit